MRTYILPFADPDAKIRIMFMDEAGFGRISEPSVCWAPFGMRPIVPSLRVREYVQLYGAVDPISGDDCYIIAPICNTEWTNLFLKEVSKSAGKDYVLLCGDNASWHKSSELIVPDNIRLFFIPPRTPEMNPIEQLWPEIRHDFKNKLFKSLNKIVEQLCTSITSISKDTVRSVTGREWINNMFISDECYPFV